MEREILVPETEKLDPVNQGAEMRSSGISFSSSWLSFLLVSSGFCFKKAFLLWEHVGRGTFSLHVLSVLQF